MLQIEIIDTSESGDPDHVAGDGKIAIVVRPERGFDRMGAVLAEHGLTCLAVLKSHIHSDRLTSGLGLGSGDQMGTVVMSADEAPLSHQAMRPPAAEVIASSRQGSTPEALVCGALIAAPAMAQSSAATAEWGAI